MSLRKDSRKRIIPSFSNVTLEPMIELISNREAVIEGCAGIVEYKDSSVCLNCREMTVTFEGSGINIKALSTDIIEVTGSFTCITFARL